LLRQPKENKTPAYYPFRKLQYFSIKLQRKSFTDKNILFCGSYPKASWPLGIIDPERQKSHACTEVSAGGLGIL
jgi:hypothetical protein